jgi:protein TonB
VIAVHALAFLLLLVPLANSPLEISVPPEPRWLLPKELPKPPIPPVVVPVVPQQPEIQRTNPQPVVQQQPVNHAVVVDEGTLPATQENAVFKLPDSIGPVDTTPMQMGSQLETITATAPRYPSDAARTGAEGRVLLRILVGVDGRPLEVTIDKSSGNRSLDRTARDHILKTWLFEPAMRNGHAVQAYGLVPIDFTMQ